MIISNSPIIVPSSNSTALSALVKERISSMDKAEMQNSLNPKSPQSLPVFCTQKPCSKSIDSAGFAQIRTELKGMGFEGMLHHWKLLLIPNRQTHLPTKNCGLSVFGCPIPGESHRAVQNRLLDFLELSTLEEG